MGWTASGMMRTTQLGQWNSSALGLDLTASPKLAFFGSSVTPNFATDTAYGTSPWNSGEASGAGYTAGGPSPANVTLTIVSSQLVLDADNTQLTNSTITAEGALWYYPAKSNRALLAVWFGAAKTTQDGTFLITWASGGVAAFTIP
ncbi:hypothetical protein [Microbispora sp. NPDC049633]|uniref:hypothetical protein n=1 Tax=Microbispora sp. NPDC049633 TaxID=3154355 RepID=UPI0034183C31